MPRPKQRRAELPALKGQMTEQCGDDLIAARKFTDLCQKHMSEIFSGGQLPLSNVIGRLSEIQNEAKAMRARSIYKTAHDVIGDLTERRSVVACASSVLVLQKLIRQYESGLSEIAPVERTEIAAKPSKRTGPIIVTDMTQQRIAAQTLAPLIKFADRRDKSSLIKLVNFAANSAGKTEQNPGKRRIDIMMPGLTNHWLRLARTQNKSISVSAALDEALLETSTLKTLQKEIRTLGEVLIAQSIETPDARALKGLNQSAHIAVTAKQNGKMLDLHISCEGPLPKIEALKAIAANLKDVSGQVTFSSKDEVLHFEIKDISCFTDLKADALVKEVAS